MQKKEEILQNHLIYYRKNYNFKQIYYIYTKDK